MATQGQVTKIYSLKTTGFDVVDKQLQAIAKNFEAIKKAKRSSEAKLIINSDIAEAKKLTDEIAKLLIKEQELRVEHQRMVNEQKAGNIARQEEIRLQKAKIAGNQIEEGSIVRIRQQIKELNAQLITKNQKGTGLINFQGEVLTIDQATQKLKQLTAAEQEFRRQFARDQTLVGEYTSGIVQAFKQMGLDDLVGGQITRVKDKLNSLNTDFDRLQKELQETRAAGKSTETIELQMIENRNEVIKLDTELIRLKTDLRGTGDIGNQVSTALSNGFKSLKGQIGSFALQFVGIAAIISKAQQGISEAKLSSDATTDLEIQLGATADEADRLNDSLKNLNTRTTLLGLQEIANIALRAGVAKEEILGVTEAIDKVKVAFGKDFGSVEQGTETFAKLINIFFEDGQITGDRILKIGNAIRALANETVASVPFITDFSGRMAGVKQIANVTLPDILGLGAGFEEFKQSAEISSTALVKVIPKLAQDTKRFADILGITQEQFTQLIETNPAGALIDVAQALVRSGGDIKQINDTLGDVNLNSEQISEKLTKAAGSGVTAIAQALADSELGAGRITTILATLGGKADTFRERIARAGETIKDTGAITDAFNKKNTNLAASMDRLNKAFSDFFASKTFQTILAAIAGLLLIIINNLPIIIGLVGLLTLSWAAQNLTLISLRAQLILYNIGIGANLVLLNALRLAQLAFNIVLFAFNGVIKLASAGLRLFGITATAASGPLGIILTVAALLGTALLGLSKAFGDSAKAIDRQTQKLRLMSELQREAAAATADQRLKAEQLVKVINDLSISEETRIKLLKDLIALDPIFQKALVDGKINYEKLNDALKDYNASLLENATLQAAQTKAQAENQELIRLINLRTTFEERKSKLKPRDFDDLSEEEIQFLPQGVGSTRSIRGTATLFGIDISTKEINTAISNINRAIVAQKNLAEVSKETATTLLANQFKTAEGGGEDGKKPPTIFERFKQLLKQGGTEKDFKDLKDDIDKRKSELSVFSKEFKSLQALEKEIENILNPKSKTTSDRGSRLTGVQKDAFKDIDALRDKELADIKRRFQERQFAEENFVLTVLRINRDAINEKLKILKKGNIDESKLNAEERKQIAELNLEKVTIEQETNNKIFDIRAKALKQQLDQEIASLKLKAAQIENDPRISATDKAQVKLDSDNAILKLQEDFNAAIDKLEKELSQNSINNTKESADEIRRTKEQILADQRDIAAARLSDIADAGEKQRNEIIANYEKLRQAILNNDKLTASQRQKALEKLAKLHNVTIISSELAQLNIEFEQIKKLYDQGLASEKDFIEKKAQLEGKQTQLVEAKINLKTVGVVLPSDATTQTALGEQLAKLFKFEEGGAEAQLLGESISQAFSLASEAMNGYFDAERDRIQKSLELNLQRLDQEKEHVLARAQSQAEIEGIEKEFAAKRRAEEKKAFEQTKKVKKSEAKLALAAELANLAVAAASAGASTGPLAPVVIPILYGVMSLLALGRYALRVGEINRESFQFGGEVKKKKSGHAPTKKGGEAKGRSHAQGGIPFNYEAEDKELFIVNKKSALDKKVRTITGTNKQIASKINELGGGISFAKGAKLKKFAGGGIIGDVLQPPVLTNRESTIINNGGGIDAEKFDELIEAVQDHIVETSKRIDRIQTFVSEKDISDAQKKQLKQSSIGTL